MALIPPDYFKAVVSINLESFCQDGVPVKQSIATGFLLGVSTGEKDENGKDLVEIFCITNRHVYEDKNTGSFLPKMYLRFNDNENKGHYFEVNLLQNEKPIWFKHKNNMVDIAIIQLNGRAIREQNMDFRFFNSKNIRFAKDFSNNDISIGDGLYVLGFPMGISGKARNFVIARQGIIARVDEEVLSECFYYIDASAYPGNSGGPVIHKPEVVSIDGTQSNAFAELIGVISSGETYSDVAISQQTKEVRIIFTEQTGLVRVVPIEFVIEAINDYKVSKKL